MLYLYRMSRLFAAVVVAFVELVNYSGEYLSAMVQRDYSTEKRHYGTR